MLRQALRAEAGIPDLEDIKRDFVEPFFWRNARSVEEPELLANLLRNVPRLNVSVYRSLGEPMIVPVVESEFRLIFDLLEEQGVPLQGDEVRLENLLRACALKADFELFTTRIDEARASRSSIYDAYVAVSPDPEMLFAYFLHYLREQRFHVDADEIWSQIQSSRTSTAQANFKRDLELRRGIQPLTVTLDVIDEMDPFDFEALLGLIYESKGYRVAATPKTGDQGADILAELAGERVVVQAKRCREPVGNRAVQEAIAAASHFRCHTAHVVATNGFTRSAKELAASSGVFLIDRDGLSSMIDAFNRSPKDYRRLRELIEPSEQDQP